MSARVQGGWEIIFALEDLPYESDEIIDLSSFKNAEHYFTKAIFRLYSLESWLYSVLNSTCRTKDKTKIDNLGPFAACLSACLLYAQPSRIKEHQINTGTIVYRGIKLPKRFENEIEEYRSKINKIHYLNGYSSTS